MISRPAFALNVCLMAALCAMFSGCTKKLPDRTEPTAGYTPDFRLRFQAPREFIPKSKAHDPNKREYVLEWNRFTTIDDYRQSGVTGAAWDKQALEALELYCQTRVAALSGYVPGEIQTQIGEQATTAIKAGCRDPLIQYLHARYTLAQQGVSRETLAAAYDQAAEGIEQLGYSPIRKVYVNLRAAEAAMAVTPRGTNVPPRETFLRRAAIHHLNEALHDAKMPPVEADVISRQVWEIAQPSSVGRYDIEGLLIPTLKERWGDHAFACWICGSFYLDQAWRARGSGFADSVSPEGWKGFHDNLKKADEILRHGWKADPSSADIPVAMIRVCMGQNNPREEMESWFERAMTINTNSYEAVEAKAYYLLPQWFGNDEELLAFGRECVASKKWGGRVPLILPWCHHELHQYSHKDDKNYYAKPEVWRDIQSAYERYFELNPDDDSHRHNYASDAFRCGEYGAFLEQLPKFTSGTNYKWFGGKKKFDAMVQKAIANAGK
jgi:hypothetical protein